MGRRRCGRTRFGAACVGMLLAACVATPEVPQDGGANEVDAGSPIEGDAAVTPDGGAGDADVTLDAAMPTGRCAWRAL